VLNFFFQYFLTKIFNLMKKVNFKVALMVLSFAFCFLLLGVNRMEAQSSSTLTGNSNPSGANIPVFNVPQGNFTTNQEALDKLMAEILSLKATMVSLNFNQGNPVFDAAMLYAQYYGAIYQAIEGGQTVPMSIVVGLGQVRANLSPAELTTMKNAAIDLLDI
jgi:hypothetical protein